MCSVIASVQSRPRMVLGVYMIILPAVLMSHVPDREAFIPGAHKKNEIEFQKVWTYSFTMSSVV